MATEGLLLLVGLGALFVSPQLISIEMSLAFLCLAAGLALLALAYRPAPLPATRGPSASPETDAETTIRMLPESNMCPLDRDALTGLATRRTLSDVLRSLDQQSGIKQISILLFDLDNFKSLNHELGHDVGDDILRQIGGLLSKQAAGLLAVARTGGDEFVAVTPFDAAQATALGEFLRLEIAEIGRRHHGLTASFGMVTGNPLSDMDELMAHADKAMYAAKMKGRNIVLAAETYAEELAVDERDELMVDFENRVRTYADRMVSGMLNHAKSLATTLRNAAEHDALTGLFNRRHLDRVLMREFEKCVQAGATLSIALIDLDDFGKVNKTHGFTSGDRVLATAARAIADSTRSNDWIARYGGEEFLVVMPDTGLPKARGVGERIVALIRETPVTSYTGETIRITGTVGVSEFKATDQTVEDLLARASDQVRLGKAAGKNQVK